MAKRKKKSEVEQQVENNQGVAENNKSESDKHKDPLLNHTHKRQLRRL